MGYQKTGFVVLPRSAYLLNAARRLVEFFGDDLERHVGEAVKSLGKENVRLSNFFFSRLLVLNSPKLDANAERKNDFLLVMADYLHQTGFIERSPVLVDYVTNPALALDDVILRMLSARMPKIDSCHSAACTPPLTR
jgi:hypothetical protein